MSSGAARHVGGAAAAAIGVVTIGFGVAFAEGNDWFGTAGVFLQGIDLDEPMFAGAATNGSTLYLQIAAAALFVTLALAAVAERATFAAHVVVGLACGGVLMPLMWRALAPDGVLGSISFSDRRFVDTGAGSIFTTAGWFALVGSMVIGPRLGRFGAEGQLRAIPGKSVPLALVGALLFIVGVPAVVALPSPIWHDDVVSGAVAVVVAGASGALISAAIGRFMTGMVGSAEVSRGLLGGAVAVTGDLLSVQPIEALVLGAGGGALTVAVATALERAHIDDPTTAIGVFGAAGVWASLGSAGFDLNQLLAQVVGQLILAAWSIVAAGVLFGGLRLARVLRVSAEVEIVGLRA